MVSGPSKRKAPSRSERPAVRAYETLRELIVDGRLSPGSRIVELELADRLGMSRTPVRSAVERLEQEGFVVVSRGGRQGRASVTPLTVTDAQELFLIVGVLEGFAGRLCASLASSLRRPLVKELVRLNRELYGILRSRRPVPNRRFENDARFHGLYVEAAAGPRLRALHAAVKPQAERYIRLYISLVVDEMRDSHHEHGAIVDAIARGDPDLADRAVQTNWQNAAGRLTAVMEKTGERGNWLNLDSFLPRLEASRVGRVARSLPE